MCATVGRQSVWKSKLKTTCAFIYLFQFTVFNYNAYQGLTHTRSNKSARQSVDFRAVETNPGLLFWIPLYRKIPAFQALWLRLCTSARSAACILYVPTATEPPELEQTDSSVAPLMENRSKDWWKPGFNTKQKQEGWPAGEPRIGGGDAEEEEEDPPETKQGQ